MPESIHVTLEFNDIKDLFIAPDYDPFDKNSYEAAGLDIISNYLEAQPIKAPVSATIYLPPEQITPDLPTRFQEALKRYKDRRILAHKNEILSNKNEGWRMAIYSAVLVVIISIVFVGFLYALQSDVITQVLTPVFTIILWVIIWQPVEMLFFENLAPRRMNRIWGKVAEMPFEFKPSPAPAGSIGISGGAI